MSAAPTESTAAEAPPPAATAPPRWRDWRWIACGLAVVAVIALALGLRLHRAGEVDLWLDETFTWNRALAPTLWECATGVTTHPPATRLATRAAISLWGDDPVALRTLPILASVLCIPLLGLVLWRAGCGLLAAGVAMLLLAINPVAVDLATWVRHYSFVMLFALALTWQYLGLRDRPSWRGVAGYGVLLALGLYTYYLFVMVPVAHGLAALCERHCDAAGRPSLWGRWASPARRRHVASLVGGGAVAFALFLPWLVYLLRRWPAAETAHYVGHASSVAEWSHWLLTSLLGIRYRNQGMMDWQTFWPIGHVEYYLAAIGVPLIVGAVVLWIRGRAGVVAWLGMALPWVFLLTLGQSMRMFGTFWHFSFVLPFVAAVLGVGVATLARGLYRPWPPVPARVVGGMAGLAMGIGLVVSAGYGLSAQHGWGLIPERPAGRMPIGDDTRPMERGPWRAMAGVIAAAPEAAGANVAVLTYPNYLAAALRYEVRDRPVVPLPYDDSAPFARAAREPAPRIDAWVRGHTDERWPALAVALPAVLWIAAPEWDADAPALLAALAELRELGYAVQEHSRYVALYRRTILWRATLPGADAPH